MQESSASKNFQIFAEKNISNQGLLTKKITDKNKQCKKCIAEKFSMLADTLFGYLSITGISR